MVFKSCSLSYSITLLSFYRVFACLKYIPILKMLTETPLRIPFAVIGRQSRVPTSHWLQGKCAKINLSQAASYIFSVKFAALESLKWLQEGYSKLVSNFKGAS